jgi:hypothetical protein
MGSEAKRVPDWKNKTENVRKLPFLNKHDPLRLHKSTTHDFLTLSEIGPLLQ